MPDFLAQAGRILREHPKVSVSLEARSDSLVAIERIWSEEERGAGHAGRALRDLMELADQEGVALTLVPHWLAYETDHLEDEEADRLEALNERKLGNDQLRDWYARLGFETTGETSGDDPVMIRLPLPSPAPKP